MRVVEIVVEFFQSKSMAAELNRSLGLSPSEIEGWAEDAKGEPTPIQKTLYPATPQITALSVPRNGAKKRQTGDGVLLAAKSCLRATRRASIYFWLRDASMKDLDNLPEPEVLAEEMLEILRSVLAGFEDVIQETT